MRATPPVKPDDGVLVKGIARATHRSRFAVSQANPLTFYAAGIPPQLHQFRLNPMKLL